MDDLLQGIKWYYDHDPIVDVFARIDKVTLPMVPIYCYMYIAELCATTKAFARTYREKNCSRHYCKQSRRAIQIIKLIWLIFVPLVLIVSPRRLHLPQAVLIVVVSLFLYVNALRTAAACLSSLWNTAVRVSTYLLYIPNKVRPA